MQCLVTTDEKINKLKSSIDNLRQNFIKDSLMTEHDEANEKADQWKRELAAAKRIQAWYRRVRQARLTKKIEMQK